MITRYKPTESPKAEKTVDHWTYAFGKLQVTYKDGMVCKSAWSKRELNQLIRQGLVRQDK